MVGNQASIAVTHAAVRTLSAMVVVVAIVDVVGIVVVGVVLVGIVVVVVVVVVATVRTKIRRPTKTRVGMFSARHHPVTGQRKTPDLPSAQSRLIPVVISVVFDLHPRDVATDTMRVRSSGSSDVVFQHKRGATLVADHFSTVPLHVLFDDSRATFPLVAMHTRIESTGEGVALTTDTRPRVASGKVRATKNRRVVVVSELKLNTDSASYVTAVPKSKVPDSIPAGGAKSRVGSSALVVVG